VNKEPSYECFTAYSWLGSITLAKDDLD